MALAQTGMIQKGLSSRFPKVEFRIETVRTSGDREADLPFAAIGAKGIFVKELDDVLLAGKIDAAVHSLKDLPSEVTKGVELTAVTTCVDPRDALVTRDGRTLATLPKGARVGTSSARRTALLRRHRPDLEIGMLRGNLDTRLRRLEEGKFDAVVVACAGLERLGRTERLSERLDPFEFVPAVGQGMLAVTCRREDKESREIVRAVNDERAHRLADIERVFLAQVGGGCEVPLGCYGEEKDDEIRLVAVLASFDGRKEIRSEVRGEIDRGEELARQLAGRILDQGGRAMIDEIRGDRAV